MADLKDYLFYSDEWATIYCGDCLEILPLMEPESVDLVVTDPPYGIEYVSNWYKGGNPHGKIIGDEAFHVPIGKLWELTKEDGSIFIFTDCIMPLIDARVKNQIVWVKNNWTAGDLEGDFGRQYEFIAFLPKPKFKLNGKRYSNVWFFDREQPAFHPTQKPVALLGRICAYGQTILDPFLGSGTTCIAAKNLNRKSIGIEINSKYCEIAVKRLRQEVFDFRKTNG